MHAAITVIGYHQELAVTALKFHSAVIISFGRHHVINMKRQLQSACVNISSLIYTEHHFTLIYNLIF